MTIADILRIIRKHAVAGIIVLAVALGLTGWKVSTTAPTYTASTVAIASTAVTGDAQAPAGQSGQQTTSRLGVVARLVTTPAVLQPVIDRLGLSDTVQGLAGRLSASTDDNGFLTITASDGDPRKAADLANSVYDSLVKQVSDDSFASDRTGLLDGLRLSVVEQASAPSAPFAPDLRKMWFMGALFGLAAAFVVILALEASDKRIRQSADVQRLTDVPVIGEIIRTDVFRGSAPVVVSNPNGRAAETIRRLALNLDFIAPDRTEMSNVVAVASAGAGEGKSTVSVNLAAAIAENGRRVLLVDTDLRSPSVAGMLGINGEIGLAHVLAGRASLKDAVQMYWKPNFHVLPAGEQHANPSILINSDAMASFLRAAAKEYDSVILDTTPMGVANDAAVFAKQGATLLLIVGQGVALKKGVREASREFHLIGVAPAGAVLNLVKVGRHHGKGSYYYYAEEKDGTARRTGLRRIAGGRGTRHDRHAAGAGADGTSGADSADRGAA